MNLLGAIPPPEIVDPLERIYRQALVRGAPRPYAVVVEDRGGTWKTTLAGLSLDSRRAAVMVARDGGALALAARWSVGGGVLLPPSTATVTAALVAARGAAAERPWIADPVILRDLADDPEVKRVTLVPAEVWHAMVGERGAIECLVRLADALGCLPLINEGPSVLLSGVEESDVGRTWAALDCRPIWAGDDALEISAAGGKGASPGSQRRLSGSWAVAELPSGQGVGRWAFESTGLDPENGLRLVYEAGSDWTLMGGEGRGEVIPEIVDPHELAVHGVGVARVPGWLTLDLDCEGSPGAVLVKALAREAERVGTVLWIPGVTNRSLPFVLRLGGRIWVDGPAVPEI